MPIRKKFCQSVPKKPIFFKSDFDIRKPKKDCSHRGSNNENNEQVDTLIRGVAKLTRTIKCLEEKVMANKAEILAAIAEEKNEVLASIQALKDQIANGSPVTAEDLDEILAAVKDIHGETVA